jgi:hypothetical protein
MNTTKHPCSECAVPRLAVGTEPLTNRYEVVLMECPICKTVVRLASKKVKKPLGITMT